MVANQPAGAEARMAAAAAAAPTGAARLPQCSRAPGAGSVITGKAAGGMPAPASWGGAAPGSTGGGAVISGLGMPELPALGCLLGLGFCPLVRGAISAALALVRLCRGGALPTGVGPAVQKGAGEREGR